MSVTRQLADVRDRVARAAEGVGRDPSSVCLVAVSKTFSIDAIREAYDAGHRDFGESKWQEAQPKIEVLPDDIRWHFIGHLQSNKAAKIAQHFQLIHTLSTESALQVFGRQSHDIDVLIEINIAEETQKAGIFAENLPNFQKNVIQYEHVRKRGLMTMGPANRNDEAMRPYFRRLREVAEMNGPCEFLSMGMSGDFEVAIQEGSTHVRVGSLIFGVRG